ncbi:MAG: hypothetical protein KC635_27405, partial [Myxococcales bacterium]|nr:hypothetical protein [Myxococcales bacterium]
MNTLHMTTWRLVAAGSLLALGLVVAGSPARAMNAGGGETTAARCSDGVDNDGDELIDCQDPSCADFCGDSGGGGEAPAPEANPCDDEKAAAKACCDEAACNYGEADAACVMPGRCDFAFACNPFAVGCASPAPKLPPAIASAYEGFRAGLDGADLFCDFSCELAYGCTRPGAVNYDAKATIDDGSCCFEGSVADGDNAFQLGLADISLLTCDPDAVNDLDDEYFGAVIHAGDVTGSEFETGHAGGLGTSFVTGGWASLEHGTIRGDGFAAFGFDNDGVTATGRLHTGSGYAKDTIERVCATNPSYLHGRIASSSAADATITAWGAVSFGAGLTAVDIANLPPEPELHATGAAGDTAILWFTGAADTLSLGNRELFSGEMDRADIVYYAPDVRVLTVTTTNLPSVIAPEADCVMTGVEVYGGVQCRSFTNLVGTHFFGAFNDAFFELDEAPSCAPPIDLSRYHDALRSARDQVETFKKDHDAFGALRLQLVLA